MELSRTNCFQQTKVSWMLFLVAFMMLALAGCGLNVPPPPEDYQCSVNGNPRAFYCVHSKTKERLIIPINDNRMKGAQCLSATAYKRYEKWVQSIIELAKTRCN